MSSTCFSVVSHGHGPLLQRLLAQMNDEPSLVGARVIVTLNLQTEAFDPSMYPSLDLKVIRNVSPKGFGANHNVASQYCKSTWFTVLNPDLAFLEHEPFTAMLQRLTLHELRYPNKDIKVGLLAPRVVSAEFLVEDSVRANLSPWSLVKRTMGNRTPLEPRQEARRGRPFFWIAGMCMSIRTAAFREIGGFDERFFLYCEDYDLCARLYNAGYSIRFDPQAEVIHEAQRDSHRNWRHLRWHLASLMKVWASTAFWRVTLSTSSTRCSH